MKRLTPLLVTLVTLSLSLAGCTHRGAPSVADILAAPLHSVVTNHGARQLSPADVAEAERWHQCVRANLRSPDYKPMLRACYAACSGDASARTVGADGDGGVGCATACVMGMKYVACGSGGGCVGGGTACFASPGPVEPHGFAFCARDESHYMSREDAEAFEASGPCADPAFVVVARRYLKLPPRETQR